MHQAHLGRYDNHACGLIIYCGYSTYRHSFDLPEKNWVKFMSIILYRHTMMAKIKMKKEIILAILSIKNHSYFTFFENLIVYMICILKHYNFLFKY